MNKRVSKSELSVTEKIEKLAKIRDENIISEEVFQTLKVNLLKKEEENESISSTDDHI